MEIKYANRTQLKNYFKKNNIPRETDFAAFIDSSVNQQEDGIIKLPGDPLSVEASGEKGSVQKLLNFYSKFSDTEAAWSVSLNDTDEAGILVPGLNFVTRGQSRLFIREDNGKAGLGTSNPQVALDIVTDSPNEGVQLRRKGQSEPSVRIAQANDAGYLQLFDEKGEAQVSLTAREGLFRLRSLSLNGSTGDISVPGGIHFGTKIRQMINLWNAEFGIGIQHSTYYSRSGRNFAWYIGGGHVEGELNPGGGIFAMALVPSPEGGANAAITGDLTLGSNTAFRRFIFHSRANGKGDYFHLTCDDEKGNWDWNKGLVFSRNGNFLMKGTLENQGLIFEHDRSTHINRDGALYRYYGQVYLTVDDNFYVRDSNGTNVIHLDVQNSMIHGVRAITSSDIRLKEDVTPFEDGLDIIRKINPVRFRYNGKGYTRKKEENIGVIAQDLKEIMPSLVSTIKVRLEESDQEETDVLAVDSGALPYILINAVKQLEEKVNRLSAK